MSLEMREATEIVDRLQGALDIYRPTSLLLSGLAFASCAYSSADNGSGAERQRTNVYGAVGSSCRGCPIRL